MNNNLSIPSNMPMFNSDGRLNQMGLLWFNNLYQRVGSSTALSNVELEEQSNQNTQDIININSELDNINYSIGIIKSDITSINYNINTINLNVAQNTENIENLNIEVEKNTTDIKTNTDDITDLKNSVIKTIVSLGTGISIWLSTIGNTANFKSIKAGSNITLDNTTDPNTIIINASSGGVNEGAGAGGVNASTAYGKNTLAVNTTGTRNSALGYNTLAVNTIGNDNVAVGNSALAANIQGNNNTAVGSQALFKNQSTLAGSGEASNNVAVGYQTLYNNTRGSNNQAMGTQALFTNTLGFGNVAIGYQTLYFNTSGSNNVAVGNLALNANTSGSNNFGFGNGALLLNTTGEYNIAIGPVASRSNTTGMFNIGIGLSALRFNTTNQNAIGIGQNAGDGSNYDNVICLGYNANTTGANQLQLGNSSVTSYAYGAVQNRSDARDKIDIRDTTLGLDFILKLRPVDFKWNYREDYKEIINNKNPKINPEIIYHENDGSRKRTRFHHGLIAQEVRDLNAEFGGFQDHNINGGQDVLSIGYEELIAPLIKAIQDQQKQIEELKITIENNK